MSRDRAVEFISMKQCLMVFQTNFEPMNKQFYSLPNNKSTPGYTVQCVLSYVEVNDPNDNWY